MNDLSHLQYVAGAYLIAGFVVLYLVVRIGNDYRRLVRTLTDLEARGVIRRSERS
jgi:heme exporter protein CcmD